MNLPAFSVRRPVLTGMVTLIAVVMGLMALTRLPIDLLPDIEYPRISVRVSYPNASPQAMEELVVKPIENAVATVQGIEEITSSASEGTARVNLTFAWGTDLDVAALDVREALEEEYEDPPEGADRPSIRKYDTSDAPIMLIGLSSGIDPIALRQIIDNRLTHRIQQIPGVAQVDLWGGPEREIQVRLRPERVQALDVPLADVVDTLRQSNLNRPGGSIERGNTEFTVRVPGRYANLDDIRETVVAMREGSPVKLGQIAEVRDTQTRVTRIIRINGEPGIRMAVRKQSGANTVDVARRLHEEIERIDEDFRQIELRALFDTSEYIERSIHNATLSMLAGGALAVTGTSGPGIALKSEAMNLAIALELPMVIVDVQRGGPSTGLPTKTEQSDLLQVMFGRNGESPIAVVAPRSPADSFQMAREACRLAVRAMTPVVLLSEGFLANSSEPWLIPDADDIPAIPVTHPAARSNGETPFFPYQRDPETLARPWAIPGTPGLEHRLGGLSKAPVTGNVSYDPRHHQQMVTERAEKIARLAEVIPEQDVFGPAEGELLIVSWGGTYGAVRSAVARAQAHGRSVAHAHLRYLNPFPRNLRHVLGRYQHVLVPELNSGQLAFLLRGRFTLNVLSYPKLQARPFKISEISQKIEEILG
jgi:pyruvate/2-oxoacid:ferredoxin oxidoreductase alpha subunit